MKKKIKDFFATISFYIFCAFLALEDVIAPNKSNREFGESD